MEISDKRNKEISALHEKKEKAETFIIEIDEEIAGIAEQVINIGPEKDTVFNHLT